MTSDSLVQISANGESRVYNKDQDMVQMLLTSIVKAYIFMDKELKMQVDVVCFCSGTTAVTMVKQGQHLVVGNIGDSRVVLGTRNKENKLVPFQLTEDLKPDVPAEAARIKRCRGCIFVLRDEPGFPASGFLTTTHLVWPWRVFLEIFALRTLVSFLCLTCLTDASLRKMNLLSWQLIGYGIY
uniref:PPM-type phosphatase domain-containing protein n=1 Tax=Brassica oleracea TaxID=3712 RepID=A0A3P6DI54_BRAOL|nr:unnamed protein product [Brassica oleracea]